MVVRILNYSIATLFLLLILQDQVTARVSASDYSARLENGALTLENSKISRTYKWNGGNLITQSLEDKIAGKTWSMNTSLPDLCFPGQTKIAKNGLFSAAVVPQTEITPEHLEAEVIYSLDQLEVKRVFRIYHDCPVIACDLYFRGHSTNVWLPRTTDFTDWVNLEKLNPSTASDYLPVTEKIELPGRQWELNVVEFYDITDRYNTLVYNTHSLSYLPNLYRGNLLFANDKLTDNGIFILKEAPTSNVQLDYPGGDFITQYGAFMTIGVGLKASDLDPDHWRQGYGFVTGVYSGDKRNRFVALRDYQKNIRIHKPERDEMILMNTWGDFSEDKRICEKFVLNELDAAARLGISHFQLDAGWQKGNGEIPFGKEGYITNVWGKTDYWTPNPRRFPNGLYPVVKKGGELGIKISLWFEPFDENSYENWEKDAGVLIGMYKEYGISTFKIDGVGLPDKLAEENFRKFLGKVQKETNYNVVFNFDVTAGRRGGYHYLNEYGNIFLENRFTDWQNYYPYTTLRNLWMLSKYVPPQNFQIELVNKWRNSSRYEGDPFGPSNYSFDYLFAITMPSQPLLWLEGTGLPDEAFSVAPVIKKYREIQVDFHSGNIFPIGDEPSGKSWSGFQSVQAGKGYFLIFREASEAREYSIQTWLAAGTQIKCTPVLGDGAPFSCKVGAEGVVPFVLKEKNSYSLYKYNVE